MPTRSSSWCLDCESVYISCRDPKDNVNTFPIFSHFTSQANLTCYTSAVHKRQQATDTHTFRDGFQKSASNSWEERSKKATSLFGVFDEDGEAEKSKLFSLVCWIENSRPTLFWITWKVIAQCYVIRYYELRRSGIGGLAGVSGVCPGLRVLKLRPINWKKKKQSLRCRTWIAVETCRMDQQPNRIHLQDMRRPRGVVRSAMLATNRRHAGSVVKWIWGLFVVWVDT